MNLTQGQDTTIAVITHGEGDAFWAVAKKGAEDAGKQMGVTVKYSESANDPQKQAQLIDSAVTEKVDGIASSAPNPDAISDSLKKATDAGIPIITLNSGADDYQALGAITHVGQTETIAGEGAGKKFKDAGATKLLCVIHEQSNIGLNQRCDGAKKGFGGDVENLQVKGTERHPDDAHGDPVQAAVGRLDRRGPDAQPGHRGRGARRDPGRGSDAKLGTFDLSGDVVTAIQDGEIEFAVDQQQYLQGYLPVVFLTLYKSNANTVGGGQPVLTGPGFVTKDNAATVAEARGGRHAMTSAPARAAAPPGRPGRGRAAGEHRPLGAPHAAPGGRFAARRAVICAFFWVTTDAFGTLSGIANWTDVASTLGIMAVAVALLMIGGEFDLSAGVMTGTTGLLMGLLTTEWGFSMWPAIVVTFAFAAARRLHQRLHGHPDQAAELHRHARDVLRAAGRQPRRDEGDHRHGPRGRPGDVPGYESAAKVFSDTFWSPHNFRLSVIWWIVIAAVATWVLSRTRAGNWIFAVGGDANAARNVGVPVARVKIALFMTTAMCAALVGIMIALRLGSVQAGQGVGEEFTYIIAAVVGGCLLTGGYGSAIGASLGALIVGMAFIGIQFSGWNTDWRFLFLGVILLLAVLVNNLVRQRAEGARR